MRDFFRGSLAYRPPEENKTLRARDPEMDAIENKTSPITDQSRNAPAMALPANHAMPNIRSCKPNVVAPRCSVITVETSASKSES